MSIRTSALLLALLLKIASMPMNGQCDPMVKAEANGLLSLDGKPRGSAVISAKPVMVPELRLRFIDGQTGQLIRPKKVTVSYSWKWLQYPYPEHGWGAWSKAYDFVGCSFASDQDELIVPAYQLIARGWYKGKYTDFPWSRKPKVDGVGLTIEYAKCPSRLGIGLSNLHRYEGAIATVNLFCSNRANVTFVKQR